MQVTQIFASPGDQKSPEQYELFSSGFWVDIYYNWFVWIGLGYKLCNFSLVWNVLEYWLSGISKQQHLLKAFPVWAIRFLCFSTLHCNKRRAVEWPDFGQVGIVFCCFVTSSQILKDCGWMRTCEKIFQSESAHTWQLFSSAPWLFNQSSTALKWECCSHVEERVMEEMWQKSATYSGRKKRGRGHWWCGSHQSAIRKLLLRKC